MPKNRIRYVLANDQYSVFTHPLTDVGLARVDTIILQKEIEEILEDLHCVGCRRAQNERDGNLSQSPASAVESATISDGPSDVYKGFHVDDDVSCF